MNIKKCTRAHTDTLLVVNPEGKALLYETRRRWENNTTLNLSEIVCVDWIHLTQGTGQWRALVIMVMELQVP
jgi:hypothetical protein